LTNAPLDLTAVKEIWQESLGEVIIELLDYCRKNDWAGFDPYDALNSRLFAPTPFAKIPIVRLAFTQIMKRLPLNFRSLLLIPKTQNPKAIGLFLLALLKLSRMGWLEQTELITKMIENLAALRSPDTSYWCWGYSFPWQSRRRLIPLGQANLVCTVFVSTALLDAYELTREKRCLSMAISAAEYILNELYWTEGDSVASISYPLPDLRTAVHNANFLGAAFLSRIYKETSDKKFLDPALKVARYSAARQHDDGSWDYGEWSKQRWVDNFHTGYNLCALRSLSKSIGTSEFDFHIRKGFNFYTKNFFREDGAPKYFHNRAYPVDIHSVAQSIITLLELKDLDSANIGLARAVLAWAMKNMWDSHGYFYYQKLPLYTNRISYMRWSQAWMVLALSTLLETLNSQCADNCQLFT
jgi:hypothetical protein